VLDSINRTDIALLDKEISNEAESELGPLKYLAETTGYPMNQVVNWFLLLIIFVFDPLAIALVIAANMAFAQLNSPEDYFKRRNQYLNKVVMSVPEGKEFNKPYSQSTEALIARHKTKLSSERMKIENQDIVVDDMEDISEGKKLQIGLDAWIDVLEEEEESEKRMNVIGQNGNDGLHYKEEVKEEQPKNPLTNRSSQHYG